MIFSRHVVLRRLLVVAAVASLLAAAHVASAGIALTLDGRDAANLYTNPDNGFGYAPYHQPPVNYAYTFGGVVATVMTPPTDTDFMLTGTDFGAVGFGMDNVAFDASMYRIAMDVTVKPDNALTHLVIDLKDHDNNPLLGTVDEEHQYGLVLPAPGETATIYSNCLNMPDYSAGGGDLIPNYDAVGLGLHELQIQFPYSEGTGGGNPTPPMLSITVHSLRIEMKPVPEPSTLVLSGLGMLAVGFVRRRNR
jgi:PEP-CTERM motif